MRSRHVIGGIAATLALTVAAAAGAATGSTWTQSRGTADRRAWAKAETAISASNVANLKPAWGWGVKLAGYLAEPVVVGDRLYTVDPAGAIVAVDTATGQVVKQTAPGTADVFAKLAVAGSLLYLTQPGPTLSDRCGLYALDRWTLQVKWAVPTAAAGAPSCEMAVDGDLAIVASSEFVYSRDDFDHRLVFLNATTGKVKGTVTYASPNNFLAPPTLRNGIAYVVDVAGSYNPGNPPPSARVRAFTASGPLPTWVGGYFTWAYQPLAATAEAVYALGFDGLRAFHPTTGKQLWAQLPAAGKEWGTGAAMAVDGDRVYLEYQPWTRSTNQYDPMVLAAVNRFKGGIVWSTTMGWWSDPVVANGLLYTSAEPNLLTARKVATGKMVWQQAAVMGVTPAAAAASMIVAGGRVYATIWPGQHLQYQFLVAYGLK